MKLKKQINHLYVKHTGMGIDYIEQSMERDKFMSPSEAKDFGLIDKILEHPPKHRAHAEKDDTKNKEDDKSSWNVSKRQTEWNLLCLEKKKKRKHGDNDAAAC